MNTTALREILDDVEHLRKQKKIPLNDKLVGNLYKRAEQISEKVISKQDQPTFDWDKKLDDIFTSRLWGFPTMLLLLAAVFWITITGANYPSQMLAAGLFWIEDQLTDFCRWVQAPHWAHGFFVEGMYRSLAWVVSVMLPPMAIFFPLFTLLEDMGYLPRVAFNLDRFFKKAGAHGKQALTMSMGFGCNAAGVISCRIIESPRERLIAIVTNNFVPCNGRFPTLIALSSLLFFGVASTLGATLIVVAIVIFGIAMTLLVSWGLSKTLLRGVPSSFTLELPPYRRPQIARVIYTSIIDRTIFVLGRAVCMAIPAGAVTWILANVHVNGSSILNHAANLLNPFAHWIGLDGFILMAFILGLPANEIVLPILIMSYLSAGAMLELNSIKDLYQLFVVEQGWTWLTAVCMMLFSLLHYPCSTTLWTIYRESGSAKWTILSALIPLGVACTVCFMVAQLARGLGWV